MAWFPLRETASPRISVWFSSWLPEGGGEGETRGAHLSPAWPRAPAVGPDTRPKTLVSTASLYCSRHRRRSVDRRLRGLPGSVFAPPSLSHCHTVAAGDHHCPMSGQEVEFREAHALIPR